ncbi:thioredoxin-disulfide reductase [Candidatus Heimdallarchaeota archaeon B3_Heim]|nr:MAG: thioredoxin-disulfide reductase [Candidatus Heimdallarchaeota archaeon B3_Heim]
MGTDSSKYDMIIIGAGPAGMATAIYASRMGWNTLVLDKLIVGGLAYTTPIIENYPGFSEISGPEFADRLKKQAEKFGTEIKESVEVIDIKVGGPEIEVQTPLDTYIAKVIVLAMGTTHRHLGVPGEEKLKESGVSYCATCDGPIYKTRKVIVVGGGNSAVTEALYLETVPAREVSLIHRRDQLRAEESLQKQILENSEVKIVWNSVVTEIIGDEVTGVKKVTIKNVKTGEEQQKRVKAVFVAIGILPNNKLAKKIGVKLTDNGLIEVDSNQRTNIPRVYACGDITPGQGQISVAVGEGTTAAISAFLDMRGGDWYGNE